VQFALRKRGELETQEPARLIAQPEALRLEAINWAAS
jgi:hypothetical protein